MNTHLYIHEYASVYSPMFPSVPLLVPGKRPRPGHQQEAPVCPCDARMPQVQPKSALDRFGFMNSNDDRFGFKAGTPHKKRTWAQSHRSMPKGQIRHITGTGITAPSPGRWHPARQHWHRPVRSTVSWPCPYRRRARCRRMPCGHVTSAARLPWWGLRRR